jgi:hypothetical protein
MLKKTNQKVHKSGLFILISFLFLNVNGYNPGIEKLSLHECGFDCFTSTGNVFDVRGYLIAVVLNFTGSNEYAVKQLKKYILKVSVLLIIIAAIQSECWIIACDGNIDLPITREQNNTWLWTTVQGGSLFIGSILFILLWNSISKGESFPDVGVFTGKVLDLGVQKAPIIQVIDAAEKIATPVVETAATLVVLDTPQPRMYNYYDVDNNSLIAGFFDGGGGPNYWKFFFKTGSLESSYVNLSTILNTFGPEQLELKLLIAAWLGIVGKNVVVKIPEVVDGVSYVPIESFCTLYPEGVEHVKVFLYITQTYIPGILAASAAI